MFFQSEIDFLQYGQIESGTVLVIGEYIDQVEAIAKELGVPLVTGKTAQADRERIYGQFRKGELRGIVLSKVGTFAIDLPDADILIQVSGASAESSRNCF